MRVSLLVREAEARVGGSGARGGLIREGWEEGAILYRRRAGPASDPGGVCQPLSFPVSVHTFTTTTTYLGLEKSCGRSLGPRGCFTRPRSAGLFMAGGGRDVADMALEALVLRRRLPLSVVRWNLRTRSSVATVLVSCSPRGSTHGNGMHT